MLKQERYDIYQEALALTLSKPTQMVERGEDPHRRQVEIWDALAALQRQLHPTGASGAGAGTGLSARARARSGKAS